MKEDSHSQTHTISGPVWTILGLLEMSVTDTKPSAGNGERTRLVESVPNTRNTIFVPLVFVLRQGSFHPSRPSVSGD